MSEIRKVGPPLGLQTVNDSMSADERCAAGVSNIDPRLWSLMQLLTGRKLIEGMGEGPCRGANVCRIIGVPLFERETFYRWCEDEGLFLQPISPFWHEYPLAGCVDLATLRERLREAIRTGERLPFPCLHIEELSYAAA